MPKFSQCFTILLLAYLHLVSTCMSQAGMMDECVWSPHSQGRNVSVFIISVPLLPQDRYVFLNTAECNTYLLGESPSLVHSSM